MQTDYKSIVDAIKQTIQKAQADTLQGTELLKEMYSRLNESATPILELQPFITGAEKISSEDTKFGDVINFLKKSITGNADLNFLINLCKEEHIFNLRKTGHVAPTQTYKAIEQEFGKPASVIESGIKNGIFDNLKSNLLNQIKNDLNVQQKPLNESKNDLVYGNPNVVKYSPIGIKYEDLENNRLILLTESAAFDYNRSAEQLNALTESEVTKIPVNFRKLATAINDASYDVERNSFTLNENWDFNLELKNSVARVNGKIIDKKQLKTLLLESIQVYNADPLKVKNFNRMNYLADADRFILLHENANLLIKLDNLEVIRNLNESTFAIFEKNNRSEAKVLVDSTGNLNKIYISFTALNESVSELVKINLKPLFEAEIKNETKLKDLRHTKESELRTEQKNLNESISKVRDLKSIAEEGSPALIKLNEQETRLNTLLEQNLKDLAFYRNNYTAE